MCRYGKLVLCDGTVSLYCVGVVSLYCVSVSKPVSSARFARSALGPLAQEPGPLGPGAQAPWPRGPGARAPWPRGPGPCPGDPGPLAQGPDPFYCLGSRAGVIVSFVLVSLGLPLGLECSCFFNEAKNVGYPKSWLSKTGPSPSFEVTMISDNQRSSPHRLFTGDS